MQWANPAEAGGSEPSFPDMIDTWIELAWQDGSLGWIGIANLPSAAAFAAYLPDEGFDEVFTRNDNRVTGGGQFFPNGLGETVDDGYRLSGAWNFGSGTGTCRVRGGGLHPHRQGGEMVVGDDGIPPLLVAVIPHNEIVFTDGWHVQGLRGTGSYDYNVTDVFVPRHRTFELFCRTPRRGGSPAFRMGLMPITAAGHASWALGVAKSMLDDVTELALTKVRMGDDASIAHRTSFQRNLVPPHGHVEGGPAAGGDHLRRHRAGRRRRATISPPPCGPTCGWRPPTPPRPAGRSCSGPTWPAGPRPSARAAGSNGRSVTCTPGPSTSSSARRPTPTARQIYLGLIEDQLGL